MIVPMTTPTWRETVQRCVEAAQGRRPFDLVFEDVRVLDVFSCAWRRAHVGVVDGVIAAVEPDRGAGPAPRRVIDGRGRALAPGFVDAHVHVESSLLTPAGFQAAVLPRGTTTAVCDPHEVANVLGVPGIRWVLEGAAGLSLDLEVMLSACVPATDMETNGGGHIEAGDLAALAEHPRALGLAEVMNVPGVLGCAPPIVDKLEAFLGRPIDGHAPKVRGAALSAYAAAGIQSCHESSELEEAREKLEKGVAVWVREGSVAKDLDALAPLLTLATSTSIGFCTDDRNPLDIAREGHLDHLVRGAIRHGVPAEVAYRAASWTVARHYGLDRTTRRAGRLSFRRGALAPGWAADLVLLDDVEACAVAGVWKAGVDARDVPAPVASEPPLRNTVRAAVPEAAALAGPAGTVHVIGVVPGKIITEHLVLPHDAPGVARLTVLERHGRGSAPANGYARGFGPGLRGAIASSVAHDSHNLAVVGTDPADMRVALAHLAASGGGFCVVEGGRVLADLPLPVAGLMTTAAPAEIARSLERLHEASRAVGCALADPFLQLAFLSLPVIPALKLTDRGLVDVERFALIDVRAA
jgi:adenine deaminase